jgi:Outer membrane receptor for ferrienterochelin and colicins
LKKLIFIALVTLASDSISSQTISGIITSDVKTILPYVQITFINSRTGRSIKENSKYDGTFLVKLSHGIYSIRFEKEGYELYEIEDLVLHENESRTLKIEMLRTGFVTEEITVEGKFRQAQDDLRTSLINISPKDVKKLPGAVEDVLRSLQSLPGVSTPNDFTSQLVIRGSGPDQNLIIMDDVEIFNPYRLYGLVSMFNPETLNDITLITGGFPSMYGDRLSAVLDVTNREGRSDVDFALTSNINIANANLIAEGRNPFNLPGSWMLSTRRTYYDLIIGPFAKSTGLITEDSAFPSFEDLQMKVAFGPFKKHKFFINGIFSKDAVDIIPGGDRKDPDSVSVTDVTNNNVISASWHYFLNSDFVSRTTLSLYNNSGTNEFEGDILDPLIDKENLSPAQRDSLKQIGALLGLEFNSDYEFKKYSVTNRSFLRNDTYNLQFGGGLDVVKTDLSYGLILDEQFKALLQSLPNMLALLEDFNLEGNYNYRGHTFIQSRFSIGERFYYQPSVRLDYYSFHKKLYLSPRLNLGYVINPLTALRFSTGLYFQSPGYEKLRDGQTFFDLTGDSGSKLKPERAVHFVLSLERWINNSWLAKVEGYYKRFDNLIVQQKLTGYKYKFKLANENNTSPEYISNPHNWIRSDFKIPYDSLTSLPVNEGSGKAVGIEISLEKKYSNPDDKFYGWLNYSYSYSDRQRGDIVLPYRFDLRHVFKLVLNYRINSWLELGARWSYSSNFPYTEPKGIIPRIVNDSIVVNPLTNKVVFNLDFGDESDKYKSIRPAYHRLDLRLSAFTKFWNADWTFYLDVMNVYNRKNIIGYDYSLTSDYAVKRKTIGMIPILPTIGFNARF